MNENATAQGQGQGQGRWSRTTFSPHGQSPISEYKRETTTKQESPPLAAPLAATVGGSPACSKLQSAGTQRTAAGEGHVASVARNSSLPWPGFDFKLEGFQAGSVYLWACGERDQDDGEAPVTVPEAVAAWVVLLTQAICYAGLWYVGGNEFGDSDTSSESVDYSILAITVSMYVLLSIAAADLCGGCALVMEGLGSSEFVWFTGRRLFGVLLVATFLTLVGASTRVLFFSSTDNVQLGIGAAAVLFIADVDEKAHAVLKNFSGKWRLFWVLEAIGMSFVLATFSVKATGNGENVDQDQRDACKSSWSDTGNCYFFDWRFILLDQPLTVTVCALLVSSAVSKPMSSLLLRRFRDKFWQWSTFSLLGLFWASTPYVWWSTDALVELTVKGCVVLLSLIVASLSCAELYRSLNQGAERFGASYKRRRSCLFWVGVLFIFLRIALEFFNAILSELDLVSDDEQHSFFDQVYLPGVDALDVLDTLVRLAIYSWWICGMGLISECPSGDNSMNPPDPPVQPMLLGWGLNTGVVLVVSLIGEQISEFVYNSLQGFAFVLMDCVVEFSVSFILRCWIIMIGTWVWRANGMNDVAYWIAATALINEMGDCVITWLD